MTLSRLWPSCLLALLLAGCSSKPAEEIADDAPKPPENKQFELAPDDAEAIKALKAAGVRMIQDDEIKRVVAVDLRAASATNGEEMTKLLALVGKLPHVAGVHAEGPNVKNDGLAKLATCPKITFLNLLQADIDDAGLDAIAGLTEMEVLKLQKTNVTRLDGLKGMKKLLSVDLRSTNVTDEALGNLSGLENLTELLFETCQFVSNVGLEKLAGLKKMQSLTIIGSQFDNDSLKIAAGYPELTQLAVDTSNVSDAGLELLKPLKNLQSFSCRYCYSVSDAGLEHLKGLPLTTLRLRSARVSDDGMQHIKDMKLELLDLNETPVGDAGIAALKEMKSLKTLEIWLTQITPASLDVIAGLANLTKLNLQQTRTRDDGLAKLKPLQNLKELVLSENPITDAGLEHVAALKKLKLLNLEFIGGVTPAGIDKLKAALPQCQVKY